MAGDKKATTASGSKASDSKGGTEYSPKGDKEYPKVLPTVNRIAKVRAKSPAVVSILSDLENKVEAAGLKDIYSSLPPPQDMNFLNVIYQVGEVPPHRRHCIPECIQIGVFKPPDKGAVREVYVHWPINFHKLFSTLPLFLREGDSAVESEGMFGYDTTNDWLLLHVEMVEPFAKLSRDWSKTEVKCTWYALLAWYFLAAGFDDQAVNWDTLITSPGFDQHFCAALTAIKNKEGYVMRPSKPWEEDSSEEDSE